MYGSDISRLAILQFAPPSDDIIWDNNAIVGMKRFLSRVDLLVLKYKSIDLNVWNNGSNQTSNHTILKSTNNTIVKMTKCMTETFAFNVGISNLIKLCQILKTFTPTNEPEFLEWKFGIESLLSMLYPFTPIFCASKIRNVFGQNNDQITWPIVKD